MSEKAPQSSRFQDALDNFDQNMAEQWESQLQGEAGKTDFSGDAKRRLEEAEAYYRHMENLDNRDRGEEIYNEHEAAFANEWEDAIADDEAFNKARDAALEEKFAKNPALRRMRNISQEIEDLRNEVNITAKNEPELQARLKKREDALNELLVAYEASDDYDEAVANMFMDPSDANRNIVANNALREARAAEEAKKAKATEVDKTDPAVQAQEILAILTPEKQKELQENDPEKLKALQDELAKLMKDLGKEPISADTTKKPKTLKNWGGGISGLEGPKETREDEAAHNFVENREEAHEQALPINEEFDAHRAEEARLRDWDEAIAENARRGNVDTAEEARLRDWDEANAEYVARAGAASAPQQRRFERIRSGFERKFSKKGAKILGAVALFAAAVAGGTALHNHFTHDASEAKAESVPTAPAGPEAKKPAPTPPKTEAQKAHEALLNSPAWTIPNGGGGEQMMNRLHVPKDVWYKYEDGFLKAAPKDAYRMDDGHVGFSHPGPLSPASIAFWTDKIEHPKK